MSAETHKSALQLQLEELVKVGVGGKYRNKENYLKVIQDELEHEEAMLRGGKERYHLEVTKAKARREEGTTLYGLVFQQKYINLVSQMINDDIKQMTMGKAGNHQTGLKIICQCLPNTAFDNGVFIDKEPRVWDVCSLIILKNVIDGISNEITINKLSISIANGLMQEARITHFKQVDKDNYLKTARKLADKNIPQRTDRYKYKAKVWTYMMNRHDLKFNDWTNVDKLHLGIKMLNYIEKLGLVKHQNRKVAKNKTVTYVEATPFIIEEIKNFNIRNELLFPKFKPMIAPPRDWASPFSGGYYGKKFNKENKPEEIADALQLY